MHRDGIPRYDFDKVLVANRGEIARRVFRTLRRMGLATVAVYSDADRWAPHVEAADEAVHIGPAPSRESYLDQDAVLRAARTVGAQAIHPGYGFLAENAPFAERCAEAGIVFIGPSPEAIRRMGDKAAAKALAAEVGVPILEGFEVGDLAGEALLRRAEALAFPLLIKACAGGGGKGMRVVRQAADLPAALASAQREAVAAFGDGALLLERYLEAPRHVEVQILGDLRGEVVHCGERDCSLQRRHQKVFEESPSPAVDAGLRKRMGEAAVALARAVGYRGAGTVEFLLAASGEFYFLEMNTRLQVEHPVTEAVTGFDLVRLQVEIARGQPLGLKQEDIELSGHAIEARLYAEDPANDFLPATGRVALWSPPELPGLRIDSGIEAGQEVGVHYDPMLAKVIAHGATRDEALRRLQRGLSHLAVGGLTTNRELLLAVLEHPAFRRGEADTAFIERHLPAESRQRPMESEALAQHAVAATLYRLERRRCRGGPIPPGIAPGWRNNRWRPQEQAFEHGAGRLSVHYVAHGGGRFTMQVGDLSQEPPELSVRLVRQRDGLLIVEMEGVRRRFQVASGDAGRLTVFGLERISELGIVRRFPERLVAALGGGCAAPMTGKVVEVLVKEGDRVEAGAPLVVLEAMKMEHRLEAQAAGIVESVRVEAGQMVDPDEVLVVVAPLADGPEEAAGEGG